MEIKLFTIPNFLTLGNLVCGSIAAVCALVYGELTWAFALMIGAAVFDFFDGFAARLLKISSPIGVQLDSLADMISFGFVPSAIAYVLFNETVSPDAEQWMVWAGSALCFILAAFSALRLAKFNIDQTQHTEFCGLPTPACALFFGSLGWIFSTTGFQFGAWLLLIVLVMSLLLISPIRMFALKFQGFGWRGNELRYSFIALAAGLLIAFGAGAVAAIIVLYILTSTVRWIACSSKA